MVRVPPRLLGCNGEGDDNKAEDIAYISAGLFVYVLFAWLCIGIHLHKRKYTHTHARTHTNIDRHTHTHKSTVALSKLYINLKVGSIKVTS